MSTTCFHADIRKLIIYILLISEAVVQDKTGFHRYRIQPNYRNVRLDFSKILEKPCGKICTYLYEGYTLRKKDWQRTYQWHLCDVFLLFFFSVFFFFSFFLIFFMTTYVVGTHLNCIWQVDAIQMGIHNIYIYKEVDKNYTRCKLNTMELLDCEFIGVCAVIRSNTVFFLNPLHKLLIRVLVRNISARLF